MLRRCAGGHGLGVQEYEEMKRFMQFLSCKCYQIAFKLQQQQQQVNATNGNRITLAVVPLRM